MADLLRIKGLAALLFLSQVSLAQQEPNPRSEHLNFSHRFHLTRVQADCLDCHAGVLGSNASSDSNLPQEETCLVCHDGSKARGECSVCHKEPQNAKAFLSPPRQIRFDHAFHLRFGNLAPVLVSSIDGGTYLGKPENVRRYLNTDNACMACHRALTEADFSSSDNLPQMADCLVCHTRIDPPFSCEFCHTAEAEIKPVSHTLDYIDLHSSEGFDFDRASCTICHGKRFTCMGCH